MVRSWSRNLSGVKGKGRKRVPLAVEMLEDRVQPATLRFVGNLLIFESGKNVADNVSINVADFSGADHIFIGAAENINFDASVPASWSGDGTMAVHGPDSTADAIQVDTGGRGDLVTLEAVNDPIAINAGKANDRIIVNGPINAAGAVNLIGERTTVNGSITTTAGGTVTFDSKLSATLNAGAAISADGAVLFTGNANVTLSGTSSISTTDDDITFAKVVNGTAAGVDGITLSAGTGNIYFSANAVGTGVALGTLTIASGHLSPRSGQVGTLQASGNVTLQTSATSFDVQLNSAANYDQLSVTGDVNLSGATLSVISSLPASTAVGTQFRIIDNLTGTTLGTFNNLPQLGTFSANGRTYQIDYQGGTGNDVVLTLVVPEVTNVTSSLANGAYNSGDIIDITVSFTEAVTVTGGPPTLALNSGGTATYLSGSGSSDLVFRYTVGGSDSSTDLDYTGTTALTLNGGTIRDALNNNATLTLPATGGVGSLGFNKNIRIDNTAPDTTIDSAPPANSASSSASFAFSGTDDQTGSGSLVFEVSLDGGAFASASSPLVLNGLSNGSHTFQVRAVDEAGNTDATAASYTWTVDTQEPDTSITANPSDPSGSSSATFNFTGTDNLTATANLTYEVSIDGGAFAAAGGTSATFNGLGSGSHTFQVRAVDQAGNVDAIPASFTWTVDVTPPDTSITSNPANPTSSTSATFNFTGSDNRTATANLTYEVSIDGGAFAAAGGTSATFNGLSSGSHTFEVRAVDELGNVDPTPASFTWVVDATPPDTSITSNPANPTNSTSAVFNFTGTDNRTATANLVYEVNLDGTGFVAAGGTSASFNGLASGAHTFLVRAIDELGNVDPTSASFSWTIDDTPPDTSISSTPANPTSSTSATFNFSGTDDLTATVNLSYEVSLDGGAFTPAVGSSATFNGLGSGAHTFEVRAVDQAGNVDPTPASFAWVVDATPPDTSITLSPADPTNSTSATFNFTGSDNRTATANLTYEISLDGGAFVPVGATSATFNGLAAGAHTFQVRAIDELGNVDPTAASFGWTVDVAPPDTSITSNPADPTSSTSATFDFTGSDDVTATANLTYQVRIDGGAFSPAVGTSATFNGLSSGAHAFEVRAVDQAGNADPTPASFAWVVDATPPDTSITSNPANPTNSSSAIFNFTGTDNRTATGNLVYEVDLDGGGFLPAGGTSASFNGLSSGAHTFLVRAIDELGNVDPTPASFSWTVDVTPPDTSISVVPADPTSSTSASFSFSGTDNLTPTVNLSYEVSLDGGAFAPAVGSSVTFNGLSSGSHTLLVQAIDQAGNVDPTPASFTWVVDATPPDTSITSNPANPTNSTSATFNFTGTDNRTATANLTYQFNLDGGGFIAAIGTSASFNGLASGAHTFEVRAIDELGNVDPTPASFSWTVDVTPPDTSITSGPADPTSSTSATFNFTGSDNVTATANLTYEVSLDGGAFAAAVGTSATFNGLGSGSHSFEVRAIDQAGNVDPTPASFAWVVDAAPPDTSITSSPADPTSSTSATFDFSGTDNRTATANLTYEVSLDGGAFVAAVGASATFNGLADGSHTFEVRAIDELGNVDPTPASFTWSIDATLPDTSITSTPANPTGSTDATFEFTGTDNVTPTANLTYEVSLDGGAFVPAVGTSATFNGLADGSHTFEVRAIDQLGNIDPTPASFTWEVDATPPDTSITSNPADPTSSTSATFDFTGTDNRTATASLTYEVSIDGGAFTPAVGASATFNGLADGAHTFQVQAIDELGNVDPTPASFTWTVDASAPDTSITSNPTNPAARRTATFNFTGTDNRTATANLTYEVSIDGGAFTPAVGTSATFNSLADGTHTFQVRAIDELGNVDATPASFTWVVDTKDKVGTFRRGTWIVDRNANRAQDDVWVRFDRRAGGQAIVGDWNGDGFDEFGIFRNGWFILDVNGNGRVDDGAGSRFRFLRFRTGDRAVVGDWNGDGITDVGIRRAGKWYRDLNGNKRRDGFERALSYGFSTDVAVVGDWNGDGKDDVGVYRASQRGRWYRDVNGNNRLDAADKARVVYGGARGDKPIVGDWNGDDRDDIGVVRRNVWYRDVNGNNRLDRADKSARTVYGLTTDVALPGNWRPVTLTNTAVVQTNPLRPNTWDLAIYGTNANDVILVNPVGTSTTRVSVAINGVFKGNFAPTGRILVNALDGNDRVTVHGRVAKSAWLYGGNGNDALIGGRGNDVMLGGAGDDRFNGRAGRDLLTGGTGADVLIGSTGDDLLIGNTTVYDLRQAALNKIMAEWARTDQTYMQRINHLRGRTTGGRNGAIRLKTSPAPSTLVNDATLDQLTGGGNLDWFFKAANDTVTDRNVGGREVVSPS